MTFILGWRLWSDILMIISWFDADDVVRRINALFFLTCLLGLTTNMVGAFDQTYTPLVAFYIAGRWFEALYLARMAYFVPMVHAALITTALVSAFPAVLWICSIYVEGPKRQALIWLAIGLDLSGNFLLIWLRKAKSWFPSRLQQWAKNTFDAAPGANIEHTIERTNAFVTLILGYSVIAILYQNRVAFGINAFFGKAVLGLI